MPRITDGIKEIAEDIIFSQWATTQKSDLGLFPRQQHKKPITCLCFYCSYPSSIKLASPNWISL